MVLHFPTPLHSTPTAMASQASCIFCQIIKGSIPCMKLLETEHSLAFLDIQPTARGHSLVIPKYHGKYLQDIPDEYLQDLLPTAKRVVQGMSLGQTEGDGFNILENNGKIAHQFVPHVHFHVIPKRASDPELGLGVGWPEYKTSSEDMKQVQQQFLKTLANI